MKIDAWRREVTGFEFEATDEQGRLWELSASFSYRNVGMSDNPRFLLEDLEELTGRCSEGDYYPIVPSPKIMQALREKIEDHKHIHEAETLAIADGRDRE